MVKVRVEGFLFEMEGKMIVCDMSLRIILNLCRFLFDVNSNTPHPHSNDPIIIEDPINVLNNVGRSAYRFPDVFLITILLIIQEYFLFMLFHRCEIRYLHVIGV